MIKTTLLLWATLGCLFCAWPLFAQQKNLAPISSSSKMIAWGWQGESMLTLSSDAYCRWSSGDGICRDSFSCGVRVSDKSCALFTKNSRFLLLQTSDSTYGVWDVPARVKIWEQKVGGSGINALAISPNNQFSAASFRNGISVFDSTGVVVAHFKQDQLPVSLAVSDLGMTLVSYMDKEQGRVVSKIWSPYVQEYVEPPTETAPTATTDAPPSIEAKVAPPSVATTAAGTDKTKQVVRQSSVYAVCVGTFSAEANAQKRLEDARRWRYTGAKMVKSGEKYSVFADVYPDYEQAWKVKKKLEEQYSIHAAVVRQQVQ